VGAIKHLQNNGFEYIPEIIKTIQDLDYIKLEENFAYLTPWVNARESNYDNPLDVIIAAKKLADLHNKSEGFKVQSNMRPRVGWLKWIETYKTRKDEILDFKRRIDKKSKNTKSKKTMKTDKLAKPKKAKKKEKHKKYNKPKKTKKLKKIGKSKSKSK